MQHPALDGASNLTGLWHGQYSYPAGNQAPVPFEANLLESDDWLGGSITERAMIGKLKGRALYATLSGHRLGHAVRFVKTYEPNDGSYTSAVYQGSLSGDALEISGTWTVSSWSGRFLMIRSGGMAQKAARRIAEKV